MPELVDTINISEIGKGGFDKLVGVLEDRKVKGYNSVGWGGTTTDLKELYPASAFAVVAEGMVRYKRQEGVMLEDTDSLRELAEALSDGSIIYGKAKEIDETKLKQQIKDYAGSHGGMFDPETDWQAFIEERSSRLKKRADAIDEADR